jgi:hypothetical protein
VEGLFGMRFGVNFLIAPRWCHIGAAKSSEGRLREGRECKGRIPAEPHE